MIEILSRSERETRRLGQDLARKLKGGEILALSGSLGSGKTTFVKGIACGLGVRKRITSPTFVLLSPYRLPGRSRLAFYHFDLYRLRTQKELVDLGFAEFLKNPRAITVIEWPEIVKKLLPKRALWCRFKHRKNPKERVIQIL